MQRPVLLVIHMLNDFLATWNRVHCSRLVCAINELVQIMKIDQGCVRSLIAFSTASMRILLPHSPAVSKRPIAGLGLQLRLSVATLG
jgi:hypothetical protein